MIQYLIEFIFGLIAGIFLGITSIPATGLTALALDYFKVSDYKSIIGAVLFVNLFPISAGSVWEFYKSKHIDFSMGWILLISIIAGSYFGSKIVVGYKVKMSDKTIKYISAFVSLITAILFYISAIYETN
jgi:uncharacterized membrane protein YfcA